MRVRIIWKPWFWPLMGSLAARYWAWRYKPMPMTHNATVRRILAKSEGKRNG